VALSFLETILDLRLSCTHNSKTDGHLAVIRFPFLVCSVQAKFGIAYQADVQLGAKESDKSEPLSVERQSVNLGPFTGVLDNVWDLVRI